MRQHTTRPYKVYDRNKNLVAACTFANHAVIIASVCQDSVIKYVAHGNNWIVWKQAEWGTSHLGYWRRIQIIKETVEQRVAERKAQ